jgi:hypothetical protein
MSKEGGNVKEGTNTRVVAINKNEVMNIGCCHISEQS